MLSIGRYVDMRTLYAIAGIIGVMIIIVIGYLLLEYSEVRRERKWEKERLERERKEFEAVWGKRG